MSFKQWSKTVKMPNKYIQSLLKLLNYYTKPDFYKAYNIVKQTNRNYNLRVLGDYFVEISEMLDDKTLFNNKTSEEKTYELWNKLVWPNILQKTFYCLCYKRLQDISNITVEDVYYDDEYDTYMNGELFSNICQLPDSDILPLIIYTMIAKHYKLSNIK
jgi:hypothetical protein